MQKVTRVPKPVIEIVNSDYELRCDSSYYGISHYTTESSKSKKKIIQKLKDISQKSYNRNNSRFVVIKLVATARCETEIKDYDKLPRYKFAVFDKNYEGSLEYHGIVLGVDKTDALKQLSSYNKRLHILKIVNGKILRNKFYDMKVIDKTVLNEKYPDVRGTQQVLYDEIKGLSPIKNEFDDPVINEEELY